MDTKSNEYHFSFFKPTTPQATANRNMVLLFVTIWAVGVFGFQIWLKVIEKPTPEPAYLSYEEVWSNIENETASPADLQTFAKATMSVLGKQFIAPDKKAALENALSWSVFKLVADSNKTAFMDRLIAFETLRGEITDISDANYVAQKKDFIEYLKPILGFEKNDVRATYLPFSIKSSDLMQFKAESKALIPLGMSTYLIHFQSFLTDTKFLGFPFHYFYTAVFLLIMFVLLCLAYCVRTDNSNKRFGLAD
ncbi:MAG: DUF4212 domain-containing protein [Bacteroidales bacterium]|nr:DUF4212 domain-containing protein [Bacteroidales bacterium]MCF8458241.1 DUF4212 domain-containing protein [Bacteroidales bacterium]